jgi:uncharacterized protein involved in tolerance to divalent cations
METDMDHEYYTLLTSATSKEEATKIAVELVEKRLVSGIQVHDGAPCYYWWNGEVTQRDYYNITGFTVNGCRDRIVETIKSIHCDEVPTITFTRIDGAYPEFLKWVGDSAEY